MTALILNGIIPKLNTHYNIYEKLINILTPASPIYGPRSGSFELSIDTEAGMFVADKTKPRPRGICILI